MSDQNKEQRTSEVRLNPGVRVRLKVSPQLWGTVDGWIGSDMVRVAWSTGQRQEVLAVNLERIDEQRSNEATPPTEALFDPQIIRGRAIIEAALHWRERDRAGFVTALALEALAKAVDETPKEQRVDNPLPVGLDSVVRFVLRKYEVSNVGHSDPLLEDALEALRAFCVRTKIIEGEACEKWTNYSLAALLDELRRMQEHHALVSHEETIRAGDCTAAERNVHEARAKRDALFAKKLADLIAGKCSDSAVSRA